MSGYTVDDFLGDARRIVRENGIRDGLESIRKNTERLLSRSDLLETYVNMDEYEGHTVIGHDPDTDIHVIVHGGRKGGTSPPHDHGPCSVIYGNYTGHTLMRRWKRLDDGGSEGPARLKVAKEYTVGAGQATAFAQGDIHSIDYPDGAFFVRVTVGDVEKQKTRRFDLERGIVEIDDRAARTG
ncbi:MAG: hypothetical protein F4Z29_12840 [Gemmatimonadetes bacterium]|nr:hypothetical protein [Gemmatimonadota bacterium]